MKKSKNEVNWEEIRKTLENKIAQNETLRKELNSVKKEAKEHAQKLSIKIQKLKDCKYHLNEKK